MERAEDGIASAWIGGDLATIRRGIRELMDGGSVRSDSVVDDQHSRILAIYDDFVEVLLGGRYGPDVAANMARELITYLKLHSVVEEKLMALTGYPEADAHKLRHRQLLNEIEKLLPEIRSGTRTHENLAVLTGGWLLDHEPNWDRPFAEYVASQ